MINLKKFKDFLFENKNNKTIKDFLNKIDYTELSENLSDDDLENLCKNAMKLNVASVCIQPQYVKKCKELLNKSKVKVCTVISFPGGDDSINEKSSDCRKSLKDGADEIDMVLNWKKLKDIYKEYDYYDKEIYKDLIEEISQLSKICKMNDKILKVIVESSELTEKETEIATKICLESDADFIKTSTGKIDGSKAEINKLKVMFNTIKNSGKKMKIKASGGIRNFDTITDFSKYTDRYGIGYKSVDSMIENIETKNDY